MSQWTTGQRLKDGKYIVEELLGFGGFGVTYRAREQSSGQFVAIKTLNALQQNKPNFAEIQEKFVNEAMCLASCRHPHIVKVYPQLFQQDGLWCTAMGVLAFLCRSVYGKALGGTVKRIMVKPGVSSATTSAGV